MRIRINLLHFALAIFITIIAGCISVNAATTTEAVEQMTLVNFLNDYWAQIGLVLSEACAFLPGKFSGIAKTLITFVGYIFSKKK